MKIDKKLLIFLISLLFTTFLTGYSKVKKETKHCKDCGMLTSHNVKIGRYDGNTLLEGKVIYICEDCDDKTAYNWIIVNIE